MDSDYLEKLAKNPFNNMLGIRILDVGDGRAKASLEIKPEHANIHSTAHGSVLFCLLQRSLILHRLTSDDRIVP